MARPREFDRTRALRQAMDAFWELGYEGTSTAALVERLGIGRSSLYAAFGSKHELFLAALDHYNKGVAGRGAEALIAGAESARAGIVAVFDHYIGLMADQGDRRGCFLNNCAIEVAPHDPAAAAKVSAGLGRMEETFLAAVERGQAAGEIPARHDAVALARYLASSLNGLMVLAKAGRDRLALRQVVEITLAALD